MESETNTKDEGLLEVSLKDQYHTAEELFALSQPRPVYYTLLLVSSIIVGAGLLLSSDTVIIGGVLVAPLLIPLLFVALALAAGKPKLLVRVMALLMRSGLLVIGVGVLLSVLFGSDQVQLFAGGNLERAALLYLIVAFASGAAGAFAWARKDVAEVLPGIALAVSLLPPLIAIGMSLEQFHWVFVRYFSVIFVFNVFGILLGAILVFSVLKFYRTGEVLEMKEREQQFKEVVAKEAKERKEREEKNLDKEALNK